MIIGIDIGATKTAVGFSYDGVELEDKYEFATPHMQRKLMPLVFEAINRLIGNQPIDGIGISCFGPLNKAKGTITKPHNITWNNLRLTQPLKKQFGGSVVLEHDATVAGIYEAKFGAGREFKYFCYLTISSGIGNSLIIDGKPLPGPNNAEAGSLIVDLHDTRNTFSKYASGMAIIKDFGAKPSEIKSTTEWKLIARRLSYGIYNIICVSAPEAIILGGGVSVYHKRFLSQLEKELDQIDSAYPIPKILPARYIEEAPLRGAIYLATKELDSIS